MALPGYPLDLREPGEHCADGARPVNAQVPEELGVGERPVSPQAFPCQVEHPGRDGLGSSRPALRAFCFHLCFYRRELEHSVRLGLPAKGHEDGIAPHLGTEPLIQERLEGLQRLRREETWINQS